MNEKVIEKLEYNKILELLSERAASEEAKMLCMETLPMRSKARSSSKILSRSYLTLWIGYLRTERYLSAG